MVLEYDSAHTTTDEPWLWPKLKVLVLGRDVIQRRDVRLGDTVLDHLIPPGIRVLDILTRDERFQLDPIQMLNNIGQSTEWPELQHFRSETEVEPDRLPRILAPSLANGNLKTLCITSTLYNLEELHFESRHIQALGVSVTESEGSRTFTPKYMEWVSKFPNAHTFAIDRGSHVPVGTLAAILLRPGTKRILADSLFGVARDEMLEIAKKKNAELIRADGFPVIFPWRLDADSPEGNVSHSDPGSEDVVERWKNARGRVSEGLNSKNLNGFGYSTFWKVSDQPFFRE